MASSDLSTKCGICLSQFTEPKILPCFHTFCLQCLENNMEITDCGDHFSCPVCRTSVGIPEGGVKAFQTNFYIRTTDHVSLGSECDVCDKQVPARLRCKQCENNFCKRCSEFHLQESFSREHILISVEDENDKQHVNDCVTTCKEHPSEEITIICKECNEVICNVCKTTSHKKHSSNLISTEAGLKRKELKDIVEAVRNKFDECERDIHVVNRQANSKHKYFDEQIAYLRCQKDDIISSINKKFKENEDTIKHLNEEQLQLSKEMCEEERLKIATMKQSIEEVIKFTDRDHNLTLINRFDDVIKKIKELDVTVSEPATSVSGHSLMENVEQCIVWLQKINERISEK